MVNLGRVESLYKFQSSVNLLDYAGKNLDEKR